jgi:hypothetical protein
MGIKDVLIRYFADITRLLNIWFQKLHEINSRGCLSLSCKGLLLQFQYSLSRPERITEPLENDFHILLIENFNSLEYIEFKIVITVQPNSQIKTKHNALTV